MAGYKVFIALLAFGNILGAELLAPVPQEVSKCLSKLRDINDPDINKVLDLLIEPSDIKQQFELWNERGADTEACSTEYFCTTTRPHGSTISWNPTAASSFTCGESSGVADSCEILAHELYHAYRRQLGLFRGGSLERLKQEELAALDFENKYRAALGVAPKCCYDSPILFVGVWFLPSCGRLCYSFGGRVSAVTGTLPETFSTIGTGALMNATFAFDPKAAISGGINLGSIASVLHLFEGSASSFSAQLGSRRVVSVPGTGGSITVAFSRSPQPVSDQLQVAGAYLDEEDIPKLSEIPPLVPTLGGVAFDLKSDGPNPIFPNDSVPLSLPDATLFKTRTFEFGSGTLAFSIKGTLDSIVAGACRQ